MAAASILCRPFAGKVATHLSKRPRGWPSALRAVAACPGAQWEPRLGAPTCQFVRASSSGGNNDGANSTYFPWRHESTPPARFEDKDDLSGMPNNFRARWLRRVLACRELSLSPLAAVPLPFGLTHPWEEDMAQHFSTAFGLALEELLKSIFRGAVVVKNDGDIISIDSNITNEVGESADIIMESNEHLQEMLDKQLIAQFASVNPESIHLKLSIRPINAVLQSLFVVPMLSREIVEKKPHLKGGYLRIEKAFEETRSSNEVKEMTYDLAREIGQDDVYTRTVIADAVITCSEFFQVKDAIIGDVLQGMDDGEEEEATVHNVRFEVVTEKSTSGDGRGRELRNWKIIDVDDMLDGNVFH